MLQSVHEQWGTREQSEQCYRACQSHGDIRDLDMMRQTECFAIMLVRENVTTKLELC